MPMVQITSLNISRELRKTLLETKPIESYSAKYVEFAVRTTLSSVLEDVSLVSAVWNTKRECWEGKINYLGKDHKWVIKE